VLQWEIQKKRDQYEELDVRGRIILKWFSKKYDGVIWPGFIWLRIGISRWLLKLQ
jgi:hypothetical protein